MIDEFSGHQGIFKVPQQKSLISSRPVRTILIDRDTVSDIQVNEKTIITTVHLLKTCAETDP